MTASALVGGLGALGVAVVDRLPGAGVTITVVADATEAAPAFADAALTAVGRVASPAVLPPAPGQRSFGGEPIDRIIILIALASALLIGVSTLYFSHALGLSWLDALYFVWTTVFSNLRIALASRERRPGLLVVARLASPELSAHVTAHGDAIALSSVALASEAFGEAALAAVRSAALLVPGATVD
jgi:hypothetical protein